MKLYHGTNLSHAKAIMKSGAIKPRSATGFVGYWKLCPSHAERVYLTSTYAPYFAANASDFYTPLAVLEIDTERLDASKLLPDEDFLEQALRPFVGEGPRPGLSLKERTEWFRDHAHEWSNAWEQSVGGLGTCAYQGEIPMSAVTRIASYAPSKKQMAMVGMFLDPSISLANHRWCGEKYRVATRWLMGEAVGAIQMFTTAGQQEWDMLPFELRESLLKLASDRSRVQLIHSSVDDTVRMTTKH